MVECYNASIITHLHVYKRVGIDHTSITVTLCWIEYRGFCRVSLSLNQKKNAFSPGRECALSLGPELREAEPPNTPVEDEVRPGRLRVGANPPLQPIQVLPRTLPATSGAQFHLHQRHRQRPFRRQRPRRQSLDFGPCHTFLPQPPRRLPQTTRRFALLRL